MTNYAESTGVFLQISLLMFVFITSIYDIYEKNNLLQNGDTAYKLQKPTGENLVLLYDYIILNKKHLEYIKIETTKENKLNYTIYYSDSNVINERQPISSNINYYYEPLTRNIFLDSTGIFYTNIPENEIGNVTTDLQLQITPYMGNQISYSQILIVNGINLLLLFIFSIIIYFIYISADLKKIAIKKMLGFSNRKMIATYLKDLFVNLLLFIVLIDAICIVYFTVKGSISISFLSLLFIYSIGIAFINILLMSASPLLIRFIHINEMIKNRNFNRLFSRLLTSVKWIMMIVVVMALIFFSNAYIDLKNSQNTIEKYASLENYYTANGFASERYEKLLQTPDQLAIFSENMKQFIEQESHHFIDTSGILESTPYPYVIANSNYLEDFTSLTNIKGESIKINKEQKDTITILIPEKYASDEQQIQTYIEENIIFPYVQYDRFFGIETTENEQQPKINIEYISNHQQIEVLMEEGYEIFTDLIYVIDTTIFDGLYYADAFNTRSIYLHSETFEQFQNKLILHHLDEIISPGTLLTPYLISLENSKFIFYNVTIFLIIFIFVLLFFIYVSNRTTILANQKKHAVQTLLGFSSHSVLKKHVIFSAILIMLLLGLSLYKNLFLLGVIILCIDTAVLFCLYRSTITNNLSNSIKGE